MEINLQRFTNFIRLHFWVDLRFLRCCHLEVTKTVSDITKEITTGDLLCAKGGDRKIINPEFVTLLQTVRSKGELLPRAQKAFAWFSQLHHVHLPSPPALRNYLQFYTLGDPSHAFYAFANSSLSPCPALSPLEHSIKFQSSFTCQPKHYLLLNDFQVCSLSKSHSLLCPWTLGPLDNYTKGFS